MNEKRILSWYGVSGGYFSYSTDIFLIIVHDLIEHFIDALELDIYFSNWYSHI